jgi:hypothetical protein
VVVRYENYKEHAVMSQRNISSLAYRKLRFTNKVPVVGDQVFLHRAPTGIIGTVVSVHEDPYVPVVDIEFSDGSVIEMVPRGNVRVVGENARREAVRITEAKLRQIIREEIEASQRIVALALRPNYDRGYRVVRVEVDERTADATQSRGSVEARYSAPVADVADMIAQNYPGETIRLDAAGYGYGKAIMQPQADRLADALKSRGVKVQG